MAKLTLEAIAAKRDELISIENDGAEDYLLIAPKIAGSSVAPELYAARLSWDGDGLHSWFDEEAEPDERFGVEYEIHEPQSEEEIHAIIDELMESSRRIEAILARS